MAKWPNVPAVYGWLSLSRRGDWLVKGQRVLHPATRAFIGRNYGGDDEGRWFFQNGPQRVYVELEYTPWVIAVDCAGELITHTGKAIAAPERAWLDDAGNLLLTTDIGIGVLDDRDLEAISVHFRHASGETSHERLEEAIAETQSGLPGNLNLVWKRRTLTVDSVPRAQVAKRFGFNPLPETA